MTRRRSLAIFMLLLVALVSAGVAMAAENLVLLGFGALCLTLATAGGLALGGDRGREPGGDRTGDP